MELIEKAPAKINLGLMCCISALMVTMNWRWSCRVLIWQIICSLKKYQKIRSSWKQTKRFLPVDQRNNVYQAALLLKK